MNKQRWDMPTIQTYLWHIPLILSTDIIGKFILSVAQVTASVVIAQLIITQAPIYPNQPKHLLRKSKL